MRTLAIALFAISMSAAASAAAGAASPVHRIVISKMAFGAAPGPIHAGDVVEWVNEDIFLHSVTAQDKSFDLDVAPNKSVQITVRQPGVISYVCKYHPSMKATLTVVP